MPDALGTRPAPSPANKDWISPLAGKAAPKEMLVDVARLERDYFERQPDLQDANQLVAFGTSGHRGSPFQGTLTEAHILAITQAICDYRRSRGTDGPLYMGKDTQALSSPAQRTALEVLAANNVETVIQQNDGVTPTPVISRAILVYNRDRKKHLVDGIVVTPSHISPEDGGFKYNPPNGGPADTDVTHWVEMRANELLRAGNVGVKRLPPYKAVAASTTHHEDLMLPYVRDLNDVVDMEAIREAKLRLGVDPLGGAARPYWEPINTIYRLDITVTNPVIDPTFSFMTVDHDGKIRMDCSSPYAMARLVAMKDQYQVAFANDPDSDRHGIVTPASRSGDYRPHRQGSGEHYRELTAEFGTAYYTRIDAPASPQQKSKLQKLSPDAVKESDLAGEPIAAKPTRAPGNNAPIGGLKVAAKSGWFAARPSGTENLYKIYAESFKSEQRLNSIVAEAQEIVNNALRSSAASQQ
jgi:alpha-D-glucose phosphate-specific phosphoglucomutase